MQIDDGKVVLFHYYLREHGGELIEQTHGDDPVAYLHGHNNIPIGVEKGLSGKTAGDKFTITVPPEEAYGVPIKNSVQRVPLKHLQCHGKPKVGNIAQVTTEQGPRQVVITKVGKFNADVDFNHPLAGKTLEFEIEVVNVREASADELQHSHAHGTGGHAH